MTLEKMFWLETVSLRTKGTGSLVSKAVPHRLSILKALYTHTGNEHTSKEKG